MKTNIDVFFVLSTILALNCLKVIHAVLVMNSTSKSTLNVSKLKDLKTNLELHQRRAEAMQKSLKDDRETSKTAKDTLVLCFDLQQALPVPNLTVGKAFYLRKAWVYNLGIHDCTTGKGFMYMWPENIAKRGSDEVASIVYKHLQDHRNPTIKKIDYLY